MRAAATQAMWFIVEERRLADDPAPPATRRADGGCGPICAALLVNDVPHRLLVAPRISARKRGQRNAIYLRRTTLQRLSRNGPHVGELPERGVARGRRSERSDERRSRSAHRRPFGTS